MLFKNVLINGGSRGIGAAMVRLFSQRGYRVAFTYESSATEALSLSKETGSLAIRANTGIKSEVALAVAHFRREIGDVHILINNAAVSEIGLFTDLSESAWERLRSINLDGALYYAQAVLPDMIRAKGGRILQISSMWGQVGASCEVAYSTTKAALIGFTKALAKEVGPSGICVNAIAPGVIATDMNASLGEDVLSELREATPLGTLGTPDDVANLALFLSEEGGNFITGQVLGINGGFVI